MQSCQVRFLTRFLVNWSIKPFQITTIIISSLIHSTSVCPWLFILVKKIWTREPDSKPASVEQTELCPEFLSWISPLTLLADFIVSCFSLSLSLYHCISLCPSSCFSFFLSFYYFLWNLAQQLGPSITMLFIDLCVFLSLYIPFLLWATWPSLRQVKCHYSSRLL